MVVTAPKRKYRMVARAVAAAATGERILASAWRHFSEQPYEQVRLADVAADAGVTVQTLHLRFGTKDELFVAAWTWMATPEVAQRDSVPVGDLKTAVRILYDTYDRDGDAVLRLLAQEERIPAVRQMADAGRRWHRGWVERTFAPMLVGLSGAARERHIVKLVVATDLLVWKLLRREMRLARRKSEQIVIEMVSALKGVP
jgi:AcrR family transcriptional regulator